MPVCNVSVPTREYADTTFSQRFRMTAIACCSWAQMTPHPCWLMICWRISGMIYRKYYYIVCFSQGKIQPIKRLNSNKTEHSAAIQENTPADQKRNNAPTKKILQAARKNAGQPARQYWHFSMNSKGSITWIWSLSWMSSMNSMN